MVKGVRERENGKQVPKRIFSLNRFTSHRATKTSGIWKLFYSNLFSSKISLISNASDSLHKCQFHFSYGLIASQNPVGKSPWPVLNDNPESTYPFNCCIGALRALIDFTLPNARQFYSSMENPSSVKALNIRIDFFRSSTSLCVYFTDLKNVTI